MCVPRHSLKHFTLRKSLFGGQGASFFCGTVELNTGFIAIGVRVVLRCHVDQAE